MQVSALLAPCNRRPRELQDALLLRHYPALARLPLVRSSGSLEPLAPDLRWRLGRLAGRAATRFGRPRGDPVAEARARTRFRRLYNLDNVGWLGVRRRAEPFRERLQELFDPDALRVMLPPPDRALALERPIAEGFGRKTLLGLMLAAAHD
jgi:hypothetical protein